MDFWNYGGSPILLSPPCLGYHLFLHPGPVPDQLDGRFIFNSIYDDSADIKYQGGAKGYTTSWILLTFAGIFGVHRFYLEKWVSGLIGLLTGGLFLLGVLYDLWTLNEQIDEVNQTL